MSTTSGKITPADNKAANAGTAPRTTYVDGQGVSRQRPPAANAGKPGVGKR